MTMTMTDERVTKGPPYVCVYASQVAVCIGSNRYKKVHEAVDMMWHRIARASYADAMRRNNLKTETQNMLDIMTRNDEVRKLVDETATLPCKSSDQVAQNYDAVSRKLDHTAADLSAEEKQLVEDVLKRNLYTNYGNAQELGVIEYLRSEAGIRCRQDDTFYKQLGGYCNGVPWFIGGKIDAISEDGTTLIEIKNRVNHLFHSVPFYENVQVQTYLQLLGLQKGMLVECLKSSRQHRMTPTMVHSGGEGRNDVYINVIEIARDDYLWNHEIVPKLAGFVDFLLRLIGDETLQDQYLTSRRRTAFVMAHVKAHIKAHVKAHNKTASSPPAAAPPADDAHP